MKRPVLISQNVRVFVTAAAIAIGGIGCAAGGATARDGGNGRRGHRRHGVRAG